MPRILTFSRRQVPKETILDKIKNLWELFSSRDKFTKVTIITIILIIFAAPAIAQQTGFFTHAGNSVYSTCIAPPPGFSQEELKLISQTRKVNWCKTLAENTNSTGQEVAPNGATAGINSMPANSSGTSFISVLVGNVQHLLLSVQKLFLGK